MGNKISLGRIVIYCGFPKRRRKTKQKDAEMQRELAAREAREAYTRALQFHAKYPQYMREVRLAKTKPGSWEWFDRNVLGRDDGGPIGIRDNDGGTINIGHDGGETNTGHDGGETSQAVPPSDNSIELCFSGMPATDKPYESHDSEGTKALESDSPKVTSLDEGDISDDFSKNASEENASEENVVVSKQADAIPAIKPGLVAIAFADEDTVVSPEEEPVSRKENDCSSTESVASLASVQDKPSHAEDNTTVSKHQVTFAPLTSTFIQEDGANRSTPDSIQAVVSPVVSSIDSANDEQSVSSPSSQPTSHRAACSDGLQSSLKPYRPYLHPRPSPPDKESRKPRSTVRPPEALDTEVISRSPQFSPCPPPSSISRTSREQSLVSISDSGCEATESSRHPLLRESLASSQSSCSSQEIHLPRSAKDLPKDVSNDGGRPKRRRSSRVGLVLGQYAGNRTRVSRPFQVKPPCTTRPKRRPSLKLNGQCVYNSGYPSMVGDRIESASEDEELWEKNTPKTAIRRHVFRGNIAGHDDLIPGSQLAKHFDEEDVTVYLKERRDQCNHYHYGLPSISYNACHQPRQRKEHVSGAMMPSVLREPVSVEGSAVLNVLKSLHEELRLFRLDTTRHLPRLFSSIERRQRILECRMDVLDSRKVDFRESGDETIQQELKSLRDSLLVLQSNAQLPRLFDSIERRQRILECRMDVVDPRKVTRVYNGDESVQQQLKSLCDSLLVLQSNSQKRKEVETKAESSFRLDKDMQIEDIEDEIPLDMDGHEAQTQSAPVISTSVPRISKTPLVATNVVAEKYKSRTTNVRYVPDQNIQATGTTSLVESVKELGSGFAFEMPIKKSTETEMQIISAVKPGTTNIQSGPGDVQSSEEDIPKGVHSIGKDIAENIQSDIADIPKSGTKKISEVTLSGAEGIPENIKCDPEFDRKTINTKSIAQRDIKCAVGTGTSISAEKEDTQCDRQTSFIESVTANEVAIVSVSKEDNQSKEERSRPKLVEYLVDSGPVVNQGHRRAFVDAEEPHRAFHSETKSSESDGQEKVNEEDLSISDPIFPCAEDKASKPKKTGHLKKFQDSMCPKPTGFVEGQSSRKREEVESKAASSFRLDKDIQIEDVEDEISLDMEGHEEQTQSASVISTHTPEVPTASLRAKVVADTRISHTTNAKYVPDQSTGTTAMTQSTGKRRRVFDFAVPIKKNIETEIKSISAGKSGTTNIQSGPDDVQSGEEDIPEDIPENIQSDIVLHIHSATEESSDVTLSGADEIPEDIKSDPEFDRKTVNKKPVTQRDTKCAGGTGTLISAVKEDTRCDSQTSFIESVTANEIAIVSVSKEDDQSKEERSTTKSDHDSGPVVDQGRHRPFVDPEEPRRAIYSATKSSESASKSGATNVQSGPGDIQSGEEDIAEDILSSDEDIPEDIQSDIEDIPESSQSGTEDITLNTLSGAEEIPENITAGFYMETVIVKSITQGDIKCAGGTGTLISSEKEYTRCDSPTSFVESVTENEIGIFAVSKEDDQSKVERSTTKQSDHGSRPEVDQCRDRPLVYPEEPHGAVSSETKSSESDIKDEISLEMERRGEQSESAPVISTSVPRVPTAPLITNVMDNYVRVFGFEVPSKKTSETEIQFGEIVSTAKSVTSIIQNGSGDVQSDENNIPNDIQSAGKDIPSDTEDFVSGTDDFLSGTDDFPSGTDDFQSGAEDIPSSSDVTLSGPELIQEDIESDPEFDSKTVNTKSITQSVTKCAGGTGTSISAEKEDTRCDSQTSSIESVTANEIRTDSVSKEDGQSKEERSTAKYVSRVVHHDSGPDTELARERSVVDPEEPHRAIHSETKSSESGFQTNVQCGDIISATKSGAINIQSGFDEEDIPEDIQSAGDDIPENIQPDMEDIPESSQSDTEDISLNTLSGVEEIPDDVTAGSTETIIAKSITPTDTNCSERTETLISSEKEDTRCDSRTSFIESVTENEIGIASVSKEERSTTKSVSRHQDSGPVVDQGRHRPLVDPEETRRVVSSETKSSESVEIPKSNQPAIVDFQSPTKESSGNILSGTEEIPEYTKSGPEIDRMTINTNSVKPRDTKCAGGTGTSISAENEDTGCDRQTSFIESVTTNEIGIVTKEEEKSTTKSVSHLVHHDSEPEVNQERDRDIVDKTSIHRAVHSENKPSKSDGQGKVNEDIEEDEDSSISDSIFASAEAKVSKPKKTGPDPNSPVMQKLHAITKKLRPNNILKEMAANQAMKEEREKQEREARVKLYRNKQPGLRNLEAFRDSVCPKPAGFVEREITASEYFQHMLDIETAVPGIHVEEVLDAGGPVPYGSNLGLLEEPLSHGSQVFSSPYDARGSLPVPGFGGRSADKFPKIGSNFPSLEPGSEMNNGLARKTSSMAADQGRSKLGIPVNPYNGQSMHVPTIQPDFEEYIESDMDSQYNILGNTGLEDSRNYGTTNQDRSFDYPSPSSSLNQLSTPSPKYRVPEARKPSALLPLNTNQLRQTSGKNGGTTSSRDLSSKVASFEAALGFSNKSDPWKPASLPGIQMNAASIKNSADPLSSLTPKPKSSFSSASLLSPIKRSALPGIGQKPLPGIGSSQKSLPGLQTSTDVNRARPNNSAVMSSDYDFDGLIPPSHRNSLSKKPPTSIKNSFASVEEAMEDYDQMGVLADLVRDVTNL